MKTFTTFERQQTSIPISEVIASDGTPTIFPEVREKGYFELDFRHGQLVVVAGKYIGHIPLNDQVVIDVQPKLGIRRLAEILEKAREPLRCLDFYRRQYKGDKALGNTIFEILVRALVNSVRPVAKEGLFKEYKDETKDLKTMKGHVKVWETASKKHLRGLINQATCNVFEHTADTPLNRLLKYAIWYSAKHLVARGSRNVTLRRDLGELYEYFDSVPLDLSMQFVEEAKQALETHRVPANRAYYLEACDVSFTLISESGIDLLAEGRDIHLASFLVDMEAVFEQYVRNVLRDSTQIREANLAVLDGNKEGKGWLFADTKVHEAKPDVVLKKKDLVLLIGDAKYKPKTTEQDRYQVIAHALSYRAKRALLVSPTNPGEQSGVKRIGIAGGESGIELFHYHISLESSDLVGEEAKFCTTVQHLCVELLKLKS